ncbi:MAG: ATP-binding protein [Candidatus Eremiobacteraeota bacterium]|nr:ATP-binding protein [Candidatus Eremiobacteraeota bacterium]
MIISIASGKGGTGKTTVAVNLALSAERVLTLADCDVEAPNAHLFFPVCYAASRSFSMKVPVINRQRCTLCGECSAFCAYNALAVLEEKVLLFQDLCHSCLGCASVCPEKAISFRERPIGKIEKGEIPRGGGKPALHFIRGEALVTEHRGKFLIRALKDHIDRNMDALIDCPPGTVLAAEAMRGSGAVLIVAEPTVFGLSDMARILELSRAMALRVLVVINKSGAHDQMIEEFCAARGVELLGRVPYDLQIARSASKGSAISGEHDRYCSLFKSILERVTVLCS